MITSTIACRARRAAGRGVCADQFGVLGSSIAVLRDPAVPHVYTR
ncbi:hypothetical protein P9139_15980 [Curtobacterium flaccumfaciens]|nr:hypothetical protein P9139_15980 [Curtobacterium flaccumfaciens]